MFCMASSQRREPASRSGLAYFAYFAYFASRFALLRLLSRSCPPPHSLASLPAPYLIQIARGSVAVCV